MGTQIDDRLAQPAEEMFERNVAHLARGGREVAIRVDGQAEPIVGFFSGMDEAFIQLCRTETQLQTLIDRTAIVAVDETGRTIATYERGGISDDALGRLRGRIRHFRSWAGVAIANGQSVAEGGISS